MCHGWSFCVLLLTASVHGFDFVLDHEKGTVELSAEALTV